MASFIALVNGLILINLVDTSETCKSIEIIVRATNPRRFRKKTCSFLFGYTKSMTNCKRIPNLVTQIWPISQEIKSHPDW